MNQEPAQKNLMASTWTKAAMVRRKFKAGPQRKKDYVLTPLRSILEGAIMLHELQIAMKDAGLLESDVQAALVLRLTPSEPGKPNETHLQPIPGTENLHLLYGRVKKLEARGRVEPLGLVIKQNDREARGPEGEAVVWVQPWLVDIQASLALLAMRQRTVSRSGELAEDVIAA